MSDWVFVRQGINMTNEDLFYVGVKLIVLDRQRRVLLLRSNLSSEMESYWDVPGGRIQKGENIIETLRRELYEETGLKIDNEKIVYVSCSLSNVRISVGEDSVGLLLLIYRCKYKATPKIRLSPEHSSFWWATLEEAALERPSGISSHIFQKIAQSCQ